MAKIEQAVFMNMCMIYDDKGNILKEKLIDNVLKTIVVSPSVNLDSFDSEEYMDDFDRVSEVANIIFGGKFRNNENLKY